MCLHIKRADNLTWHSLLSVLQGALSERPQIFLDQIRQSTEVSTWPP